MAETTCAFQFGVEESLGVAHRMVGGAHLGDPRRVRCAVRMLASWFRRPGASVAQASADRASAKAGYRLLANPRVTAELLGESIYQDAADRCGLPGRVFIVQDTTTLSFGKREPIEGLGPTDSHGTQGLFVHTSLALSDDGTPIGVVDQRIWERSSGKLPPKHLRPMSERESMKWLAGMRACARRLPEECVPVFIFDREGDIHEVFAEALAQGYGVLVRARCDRNIAGEAEKLFAAAYGQEVAMRYVLQVPRKAGAAPAREARMALRYTTETLQPNCKHEPGREPVEVSIVVVTEETPGEKKPLEWRLVTTEPVRTAKDALVIATWYTWRWRVEEFHLVLKSGCRIESHQFDYADRIEKAVVLLSAVASEVERLTYLGRTAPETPASEALDATSLEALTRWARGTRNRLPAGPLALHDAVRLIGRLGGHLGRKCDGPVGVRSFWAGWTRLQDMALMLRSP